MKLNLQLTVRILLVAMVWGLAMAGYALGVSHGEAVDKAQATAQRMAKQLALQKLRIATGTDREERFPDAGIFDSQYMVGLCVRLTDTAGNKLQNKCVGSGAPQPAWPPLAEALYRRLFTLEQPIARPVELNGRHFGDVVVTPSADYELGTAARAVRQLAGSTAVTLAVVSMLTYFMLARLLKPIRALVQGLERLRNGELEHRLPHFKVREFDDIGVTFNRLATALQSSRALQAKLSQDVLTAHEDQRRLLIRDLHDEIGQSLAAIHALSASIRFTAERECPNLVEETAIISQTVAQTMQLVRNVLGRLRPPELEACGLGECLTRLVESWTNSSGWQTRYSLQVHGPVDAVPMHLAEAVYRIVQEGLTNAAKHAQAQSVCVRVDVLGADESVLAASGRVQIDVSDDGSATSVPDSAHFGLGLNGMRNRVHALGGRFALQAGSPSGLRISIQLPLTPGSVV